MAGPCLPAPHQCHPAGIRTPPLGKAPAAAQAPMSPATHHGILQRTKKLCSSLNSCEVISSHSHASFQSPLAQPLPPPGPSTLSCALGWEEKDPEVRKEKRKEKRNSEGRGLAASSEPLKVWPSEFPTLGLNLVWATRGQQSGLKAGTATGERATRQPAGPDQTLSLVKLSGKRKYVGGGKCSFFGSVCLCLLFALSCALSQGPRVSAVFILRPLQKVTRSEPHRFAGSPSPNPGTLFSFFRALLDHLCSLFGKWGKSEGGGLIY